MRRLAFLIAVLFLCAGFALAQKTPPGGDMVGSDHAMGRNGVRTEPAVTPDANQRVTGTNGSSSGYDQNPTFAGSSSYGTATAVNSPGREGMQGQTSATAGRRQAFRLSGKKGQKQGTQTKGKATPKPAPQGDVPW